MRRLAIGAALTGVGVLVVRAFAHKLHARGCWLRAKGCSSRCPITSRPNG
jgi:hypothetical protein